MYESVSVRVHVCYNLGLAPEIVPVGRERERERAACYKIIVVANTLIHLHTSTTDIYILRSIYIHGSVFIYNIYFGV